MLKKISSNKCCGRKIKEILNFSAKKFNFCTLIINMSLSFA